MWRNTAFEHASSSMNWHAELSACCASSMHVCQIQFSSFFLTFSNLPLSPGDGTEVTRPYIPACPATEVTACLLAATTCQLEAMACQREALLATACGVAAIAATEADPAATEAATAATEAATATITMEATEAATAWITMQATMAHTTHQCR